MNKIFLLILAFISGLLAGPVTSIPEFPTEQDSIIIIFDPTETGLSNYTGDVYMHSGVTINGKNWQHVIGDWGVNSQQPKLTRLINGSYSITIGFPREFYLVGDDEGKIEEISFVFRSSDSGTQTYPNIVYKLYSPGITSVISSPQVDLRFGHPLRSPLFYHSEDSLDLLANAVAVDTDVDYIQFWLDGNFLIQNESDTLSYKIKMDSLENGVHQCDIVSMGTGGLIDTVSFAFILNPEPQMITRPSNISDGINYDGTSVTLSLFAPYKDFVYVIGDFNDWKVDEAYLMNQDVIDNDNVYHWLTMENLEVDTEYAFQYFVDGEIRVTDPYTEKVLDPWNDKYISSETYPNLKAYPEGKTDQITGIIECKSSEFTWADSSFKRPTQEKLVIYELLIRDFVATHSYKTLMDTLDYFVNLGINAIELMPVSEFEGNESWGYNPAFYFAADKYYGSADDLKAFINEAHKRGIAVILDIVLNHSYGQSPLVRLYNEGDYGKPLPENPWYNVTSPNTEFSWGYDFNHESPQTEYFIDRVAEYWLTQYHFDGFRYDFTKGFTNTPGNPGYDNPRIQNIKRMGDAIWTIDENAYVILEHWADNDEERILSSYGFMLWGNSNYNYNQGTMGYMDYSDFSWGYFKSRIWTEANLVTYMESHDEERLMFKNLEFGNSSGDYSIKYLTTALERIKLATTFFLTIPGPKMIWQFGELGYDVSIDYNGRIGNKPILWNYLEDENRRKLYQTYASLNYLRQSYETFTSKNTSVNLNLSSKVKTIRLSGSDINAFIAGNFDVVQQTVGLDVVHYGMWYEYFTGDSINIENPTNIKLYPGQFLLYTDKYIQIPYEELITSIKDFDSVIPDNFNLSPAYPNPFNPITHIQLSIPNNSNLRLNIYNIKGQKVKTLYQGEAGAGSYTFEWNGKNDLGQQQSSGVYIFKADFKNKSIKRKAILLR